MDTLSFIAILLICATLGTIIAYREQAHATLIDNILQQHKEERKDLVDRLMSRDLREVKQAQAIRTVEPRVISKRQNDAKLVEEARKVEGGRG